MPSLEQARAWYAPQDPVHGFDHVLRVLELAERLGRELGADLEVLRAAALLHDAAGAAPAADTGETEQAGQATGRATHELDSAAFALSVLGAEGWPAERIEAVTHCIRAHRFRGAESPSTREAQVLFDADKLDVLGAFGVARTLGYALQAGQPFFAEPSAGFQETGALEPGEPHSAYHEYLFKLRQVSGRLHTQPARRLAERRHAVMKAFFEQLAAEAHGDI
ncbi:MAG TPA: HD domain-containing protein [Anaerolineales bacterium]|nr:HD domain-containing protein [Anaerolineales bacterium]